MGPLELVLSGLVPAALRSATPLLFALVGETITQRAGVVNLGIEGQMLVGAASAFGVAASTGNPWLGLAAGSASGLLLSLGHAGLVLGFRANQFASGLAIWMIGFGLSGYYGAPFVGQSIEGFSTLSGGPGALPLLSGLTPTVPMAFAASALAAAFLYWTRPGLALRAAGESHVVARAAGLRVDGLKTLGIAIGGALSGLGGAALAVDYANVWTEGMTKGRGLVAVGLVIVARYNPLLAVPAALLFGGAEALSLRAQSAGASTSAHLLHALPYATSLAVFVLTCLGERSRNAAPAGLRSVLER
jgi:ABC-type uncharacterized transport system permease subunit